MLKQGAYIYAYRSQPQISAPLMSSYMSIFSDSTSIKRSNALLFMTSVPLYEIISRLLRSRIRDPSIRLVAYKGIPALSYRSSFSTIQLSNIKVFMVKLRPTSSLTPSLAVTMSGSDSEPKAVCRDGLGSPRVGFRASLAKILQRCVERIFSSQSPSTPPHRAGSTLSHPQTPSRTASLIVEEDCVTRQVREIYCKLLTASLSYRLTSYDQRLIFVPLQHYPMANILPKPFAVRASAKIML